MNGSIEVAVERESKLPAALHGHKGAHSLRRMHRHEPLKPRRPFVGRHAGSGA